MTFNGKKNYNTYFYIRTNLNNSILSSTRTIRLKLVKKIRVNQEQISNEKLRKFFMEIIFHEKSVSDNRKQSFAYVLQNMRSKNFGKFKGKQL